VNLVEDEVLVPEFANAIAFALLFCKIIRFIAGGYTRAWALRGENDDLLNTFN